MMTENKENMHKNESVIRFGKETFCFLSEKGFYPNEYEMIYRGKFYKSLSWFLKASTFWISVHSIFYMLKSL